MDGLSLSCSPLPFQSRHLIHNRGDTESVKRADFGGACSPRGTLRQGVMVHPFTPQDIHAHESLRSSSCRCKPTSKGQRSLRVRRQVSLSMLAPFAAQDFFLVQWRWGPRLLRSDTRCCFLRSVSRKRLTLTERGISVCSLLLEFCELRTSTLHDKIEAMVCPDHPRRPI